MKVIKLPTPQDVTNYLAQLIIKQIKENPQSVIGLATGSTPTLAYHELVKDSLLNNSNYENITTFNLDKYVGIDDKNVNSYRYFMNENLFNYINIKEGNTFFPSSNLTNDRFDNYDELIKLKGGIDLQVLGIGENGHIGFNEPQTNKETLTHKVKLSKNTIKNNSRFFDSIDEVPKYAVTMGIKSILNSRKIVLAATGVKKAKIIEKLIYGDITVDLPASFLKTHKDVIIIVDDNAGMNIKEKDYEKSKWNDIASSRR